MVSIDNVIRSWQLSAHAHELEPPLTPEELRALEPLFGGEEPADLVKLYEFTAGGGICGSNLVIDRLVEGTDLKVLKNKSDLREWRWTMPDEAIPFGGDGCGSVYMLWIGDALEQFCLPVIEHVEDFDNENLHIIASRFPTVLAYRTAYFLAGDEEEDYSEALAALGVPSPLREFEDSEEYFAALVAWADPVVSYKGPDGDGDLMDESEIRTYLTSEA